jgi:hypothetical protein
MQRQPVYVVHAEGEEPQAELLALPLREAGYDVIHNGTVVVGESLIGWAMRAVTGGAPVVLCATSRAIGSAWAHQIVNAGHSGGRTQVFVVQMERQAYVEQLAMRAKVARYCDDPAMSSPASTLERMRQARSACTRSAAPSPRAHAGHDNRPGPDVGHARTIDAIRRSAGRCWCSAELARRSSEFLTLPSAAQSERDFAEACR